MTTKKTSLQGNQPMNFDSMADMAKLFGSYEELNAFGKANVEAFVESSVAATKAMQTVGKAWAIYAQKSVQQSVAMAKALSAVKTLCEAAELQTDFAKNSFDGLLVESQKLSELTVEAANQAIEPLKARFAEVENFMKPRAA